MSNVNGLNKEFVKSFESIYLEISEYIINHNDEKEQELYLQMINCAKQYIELRCQWNSMSNEEVVRRNSERSQLHDNFILSVDLLAEYMEFIEKNKVNWRRTLGNNRRVLGDFAEYLMAKCICPKCKSNNVIPIVYGYPTPEAFEEVEKGNLKLGGCCIIMDGFQPDRHCKNCGNEWFIEEMMGNV